MHAVLDAQADAALVLGSTLRLTRLVTHDSLGEKMLRGPARRWTESSRSEKVRRRRAFWTEALNCPYCVGFHIGLLTLFTRRVARRGAQLELWRFVAAALTLNEAVGRLAPPAPAPASGGRP